MTCARVIARRLVDGQSVVDVLPVVRRNIGRIDAERLDGVNGMQHTLDLGPTVHAQEDVAAGAHKRQCLEALALC